MCWESRAERLVLPHRLQGLSPGQGQGFTRQAQPGVWDRWEARGEPNTALLEVAVDAQPSHQVKSMWQPPSGHPRAHAG